MAHFPVKYYLIVDMGPLLPHYYTENRNYETTSNINEAKAFGSVLLARNVAEILHQRDGGNYRVVQVMAQLI